MPLIGDFHYNGHTLLAEHPACAEALAKYRINPGNVGFKDKRDRQFADIIEIALQHDKPVRIGVNWGSLDQELLTRLMDENATLPEPQGRPRGDARGDRAVGAAQRRARRRARPRRRPDHPLGQGQRRAGSDQRLSRCSPRAADYALHLGLTEAGMGSKGIVASTAALGVLLQEGIGDTIRVSLTPEPGGDRTLEVKVAQEILQTHGLPLASCRWSPPAPAAAAPPRTIFQELARDIQDYIRDADAGLEAPLSRRRDADRRGDGLHRQRPRRIASTPTSASRCPAPARRRPRRCSSTARRP